MTSLRTDTLLKESRALIADVNHVGATFCLVDLDMAHTMLDRADLSRFGEVRTRNIGNARTAHDAIRHLIPQLRLNEVDARDVEQAMERLEKRLAGYA